ncbi:unnamed protein product [Eruca vesicaria subsp. sativa]|uniref:DUF1289 domain-containing protein n=1 Tax=Eruca vesicaria subsp. sativa TaxID=29727 RepID=A0ABC8IVM1_ERUVS|nr:unnamed protein product [Eruca vesicaria subsp. sativa]
MFDRPRDQILCRRRRRLSQKVSEEECGRWREEFSGGDCERVFERLSQQET